MSPQFLGLVVMCYSEGTNPPRVANSGANSHTCCNILSEVFEAESSNMENVDLLGGRFPELQLSRGLEVEGPYSQHGFSIRRLKYIKLILAIKASTRKQRVSCSAGTLCTRHFPLQAAARDPRAGSNQLTSESSHTEFAPKHEQNIALGASSSHVPRGSRYMGTQVTRALGLNNPHLLCAAPLS